MSDDTAGAHSTLALSTKLEEDFVSPLTAVRGSLEILRDFPDLSAVDRRRFVDAALRECARLEKGVADLAATVYAAGQRDDVPAKPDVSGVDPHAYAARMHFLEELDTLEVDLSEFEFSSSKIVNEFHDVLEKLIRATGRNWYVLVNYRDCSVWPEAWVASAHRGKKLNVNYSLGTVRYVESEDGARNAAVPGHDPNMFPSRAAAIAHIESLRAASRR